MTARSVKTGPADSDLRDGAQSVVAFASKGIRGKRREGNGMIRFGVIRA